MPLDIYAIVNVYLGVLMATITYSVAVAVAGAAVATYKKLGHKHARSGQAAGSVLYDNDSTPV